jgi:hypothetical protein
MVIPRIGMEVLVEFLEGDPDKPLVIGNVFNGRNDAPYPLPAHKTKAVWRIKTHQGRGYNELGFEGEAGRENIALHAQKDRTLKALNKRMKRGDYNQVESVGSNKSIEVGSNHQERIGRSMNLTAGGGKSGLAGLQGRPPRTRSPRLIGGQPAPRSSRPCCAMPMQMSWRSCCRRWCRRTWPDCSGRPRRFCAPRCRSGRVRRARWSCHDPKICRGRLMGSGASRRPAWRRWNAIARAVCA